MSQSSYNNNNLSLFFGLAGLMVVTSTVFKEEISQVKEAGSKVFAAATVGSQAPAALKVKQLNSDAAVSSIAPR